MPSPRKRFRTPKPMKDGTEVVRVRGRLVYRISERKGHWGVTRTKLRTIELSTSYPLRVMIRDRIKAGKRPVVVDWGCGKGSTLAELSRTCPGARYYGFADQFFSNWRRIKNVKFVHRPAEDFFRLFKDNSIDFLYSHAAIEYLGEELSGYVKRLVPKLKKHGVLALNVAHDQVRKINEALQNVPGVTTLVYPEAITVIKV